ncbi:MAG: macro domain-containing protein [Candidatus Eremiobacteraeota bacterium]|nr:macro domain-containing protein [Candidatus Eremiobacteraeota bacterium]MCW5869413.1 macro domain-containing protein [Candidatus Eremiobacteraeota bacterium]
MQDAQFARPLGLTLPDRRGATLIGRTSPLPARTGRNLVVKPASLALAREHELSHIAFPCIAAGVYEFPGDLAARIAVEEVQAFMAAHSNPRHVTFCCFQEQDLEHYRAALTYA